MGKYLIAVGLAVLIAPFLHEGCHWFVTWLGHGEPRMEFGLLIIPNGVVQENIEDLDSEIIRAAGIAPMLWIPIGIIACGYFLADPSPYNLFVLLVPVAVVMMSTESDAIAFREPETYREMVIDGEFPRNPLFIPNRLIPDWVPRF